MKTRLLLTMLIMLSACFCKLSAQERTPQPEPQPENLQKHSGSFHQGFHEREAETEKFTAEQAFRTRIETKHSASEIQDSDTSTAAPDLTGTPGLWTGTVSSNWFDPLNWSDGFVPTQNTNVTIPAGTPYSPEIGGVNSAYCNNLLVTYGATLIQNAGYFRVYGCFDPAVGQFTMIGSSSYLYFEGTSNNYWYNDFGNDIYTNVRVNKSDPSSTTTMKNSTTCSGTFQVWNGQFEINSNRTLTITSTSIYSFQVQSGGALILTDNRTIETNGGVYFLNGSQASISGGTIRCGGNFRINENSSTNIELTNATVALIGTGSQLIQDLDGNSIHHLTINKPSGTATVAEANLSIAGNLNITSGAFSLGEYNCDVTGNINIHGSLIMPHTAVQWLESLGNVAWFAGSSANMSSSSKILVYGNWNFNNGSSVNLNNGIVDFRGSNTSWIRSFSDNSNFHILKVNKSDGFPVIFSNLSTHDLIVNGYVHLNSTSALNSYSNQNIILKGDFYFHGTYDFTLNGNTGSVVFDGSWQTIHNYGTGSGVFNNVVINSTTQTDSNDDITIAGNLTIEQGYLNPGANTINIAGNWTNNNFPAGFVPGDGSVIFNGSHNQSILSNENFNILEADLGGHIMVDNAAHTVTCNQYDWTSGGIEVLAGNFTALDLAQNGLFGGYLVNPGAEINLHQDNGSFIDLNGSLTFNGGGTISVYGGSTTCFIPWAGNASISMNGGILDFKDHGMFISNSPGYTFTQHITGGVIRTSGGLTVHRNDFTPSGGMFEFYGSSNRLLFLASGSHLYNLHIDKNSIGEERNIPYYPVYDSRSGEMVTDGGRSAAISLNSNVLVTNNIVVESGTLNIGGHELTVNKKADIYGTLNMTNAAGVLNVGTFQFNNLKFFDGSTASLLNGNVYLKSWITVEPGASFFASTDNTIHFIGGNLGGGLANDEPTALFGNVEINKTANPAFFSSGRTGPYNIQGDFTIHAGNVFQTGGKPIKISGIFNNDPTSSTLLYYDVRKNNENICSPDAKPLSDIPVDAARSGVMEIESDYTLNGLLDVGSASADARQMFDLASTGILNISGGSFINSKPYTEWWTILYGSVNMTDGVFELTYNHPYFYGISNISGGIIRTGGAIGAEVADVFKPSGGTVEITGSGVGVIKVYNGNYFHNLVIDRTTLYAGFEQTQPAIINNDLFVNNGRISSYMNSIKVFGNVVVNDGGSLEFNSLGSLLMAASKSVTVNSGGSLRFNGNIENQPKISGISAGNYALNIESGGTIGAVYALFEHMNTNGINLKPGAIVHHSKAFHYCTFRNGQSGGRLLTLNNNQTFSVHYANFPNNSWGGTYNVFKTENAGVVTFMGFGGLFSGESNEWDPYSRVHWGGETAANVSLQDVDIVPGQEICFEATNTLTLGGSGSSFAVQNGGYVELVAGQRIRLLEGVHFHHGSYGLMRITTSGDYCSLPAPLMIVAEEKLATGEEITETKTQDKFFKVYPNPTTGMFSLELSEITSTITVEIYGLMGEQILRQEVSGYQLYEFDLSRQPRGIYIIRVLYGDEVGIEKVIRQ